MIDRDEAIAAAVDYFNGVISKDHADSGRQGLLRRLIRWRPGREQREGEHWPRKALAVLAVAGAALLVVALLHAAPVEATSHGAVRSFSASSVLPGGRLEVAMVLTGYGGLGQVVETAARRVRLRRRRPV